MASSAKNAMTSSRLFVLNPSTNARRTSEICGPRPAGAPTTSFAASIMSSPGKTIDHFPVRFQWRRLRSRKQHEALVSPPGTGPRQEERQNAACSFDRPSLMLSRPRNGVKGDDEDQEQ